MKTIKIIIEEKFEDQKTTLEVNLKEEDFDFADPLKIYNLINGIFLRFER